MRKPAGQLCTQSPPGGLCGACLLTTAIEEGEKEETASGSRIQDYELLSEVARGRVAAEVAELTTNRHE